MIHRDRCDLPRDGDRRGRRDPGRRRRGQAAEAREGPRPRRGGALQPLEIGAGAVICGQAIVFAGSRLGEGVIVGDQAFVRERVTIGERTSSAAARRSRTTPRSARA